MFLGGGASSEGQLCGDCVERRPDRRLEKLYARDLLSLLPSLHPSLPQDLLSNFYAPSTILRAEPISMSIPTTEKLSFYLEKETGNGRARCVPWQVRR